MKPQRKRDERWRPGPAARGRRESESAVDPRHLLESGGCLHRHTSPVTLAPAPTEGSLPGSRS
jgi:hypothetical protein